MESLEKYYTLLGLQPDAELSEVEEAYKKKLERYKSDYYSDDPAYARKRCRELDKAYKTIRSSLKKEEDWVAIGKSYIDSARQREEDIDNGVIEISPAAKRRREREKREEKESKRVLVIMFTIISLLLLIIPGPPPDFDPEGYVYISDYSNVHSRDLYIAEVASEAKKLLEDYAIDNPREEVRTHALGEYGAKENTRIENKFVESYWNKEYLEQVADYLADNYEGYTCDSDYFIGYLDNAIYAFYGFMSLDKIGGYRNPYNDEIINSWTDMLSYYTEFYEKYSKRFPYKGEIYTGSGKQD